MTVFLDEVNACIPALRRYALALTHSREQADDLVQDCLERALRKRRLWRPTGPLQAWLFTLLVNIYRNDLRQRRRRPVLVEMSGMTSEFPVQPGQHPHLALNETLRAMDRLSEDQRQVLLLVALEGFSYKAAADILDIPQGTLMSRLGRARAALRTALGQGKDVQLRTVK